MTGGSLRRSGSAKDWTDGALQRTSGAVYRTGGGLQRSGGSLDRTGVQVASKTYVKHRGKSISRTF